MEVIQKAITKKTKNLMVGQQDGIGEICCMDQQQMEITKNHVHRQASALAMVHEEKVSEYLDINSSPSKFTIYNNTYLLKDIKKFNTLYCSYDFG